VATENGRSDPSVADRLQAEPYRFRFFQAVRLFGMLSRKLRRPEASPGYRGVRFRTPLSLAFPAGDLASLEPGRVPAEGGAATDAELTVNFMGLTGPSGVLPTHYTETLIAERAEYRQSAVHRFFDMFGHRMVALFADAGQKYRFWARIEQGDHAGFTRNLLDLIGLGTSQMRDRMRDSAGIGIDDRAVAYYSGLLSQRPHSAAALGALLADYFQVAAKVEQFCGRWLMLPPETCICLGDRAAPLGVRTVIGDAVWDHQSTFRVVLGPLDQVSLKRLLPGGSGHASLTRLIRFIAGVNLDYEIQLVVSKEEIPVAVLGDAEAEGSLLGLTSWMSTEPFTEDAYDLVLAA